jgi:hypothetical protein
MIIDALFAYREANAFVTYWVIHLWESSLNQVSAKKKIPVQLYTKDNNYR